MTVLCLGGIGSATATTVPKKNPMLPLLAGAVTAGELAVQVKWDARRGAQANVVDGAAKFDAVARSTAGTKIAFGYDLGAAALTYWLKNYGPSSSIQPTNLAFVLVGNPARKYGGFLNSPGYDGDYTDPLHRRWTAYPLVVPSNTPYTVLDVARQYDGLADWPDKTTDPNYKLAAKNAASGIRELHRTGYNELITDDPDNAGFTDGNTTYILGPTMPAPCVSNLHTHAAAERADRAVRSKIDACYSWDRASFLYTPMVTEPFPDYGTVTCADPDHFYVRDGQLTPQPWMQHRLVASQMANAKMYNYAADDGEDKTDTVSRVVLEWDNLSPLPHWVYGIITRGGMRMTLTARSRGYLQILSGLSRDGELPELTESSRFGCGADVGRAGQFAEGGAFCIAEIRQNSRSLPLTPEQTGWMWVEPGETATAMAELKFITEFWESSSIDGGAVETESGFMSGELKLDLFAVPIIEAAGSVVGSYGSVEVPPVEPGLPYTVPFDVGE